MKMLTKSRMKQERDFCPRVNLDPERPDKSSGFYFTIMLQYYLGLWPSDSQPNSVGSYLRHYLFLGQCVRMLYSLYFQLISMDMVWGDILSMTEYAMNFGFYFLIWAKMGVVYVHRHRIKSMLEILETYNRYSVFESTFRTDRVLFCKKWCRFLTKNVARTTISIMALGMIQMVPHAYANRRIPFRLYFPYDASKSPMFELTLLTMFPLTLLDFLYIAFCDSLFIVFLLNLSTQFAVLRYNIEHLQELSQSLLDEKTTKESFQEVSENGETISLGHTALVKDAQRIGQGSSSWHPGMGDVMESEIEVVRVFNYVTGDMFCDLAERLERVCVEDGVTVEEAEDALGRRKEELREEVCFRLGECVKYHRTLIKLTLELKYVFKYMLAVQVTLNVFISILGLYISTLAKSTDSKVMMISTIFVAGVTEFVFFCWFAESLTEQSAGVATAVYDCAWLDMDLKTQKSLRLIMSRAQRACVVTAAGIPLSRKTFRAVSKLAYYFHALLTRFYWGEKLLKTAD